MDHLHFSLFTLYVLDLQAFKKELAKKKIIETILFQKDAIGLQVWHPDWKPDDQP